MMRKWLTTVSVIMAIALLLLSCAPAAAPAPTVSGPPKPGATPVSPAAAPTAAKPAATPAAPSPVPKPSGEQPRYGGVLPISLYLEPPHLDLQQSQILVTRMAAIPPYDTLLEYNPLKSDTIIPDLAEKYEVSSDGLVYTFSLNKGVKFHDGAPLTSEDVKYNLDRLRNPPRGVLSPRAALLASIDRIETPDANTVKIFTKYMDASFLGGIALSHHVIYPKKVVEEKGDMKKTVMGTGPFRFVRYETGVIVEYTKNKEYFRKDRPYLDGLVFYIMTDSATRFAAFRTGRVLMTSQGSGGLNPVQAEITEKELKGKAHPLRYVSISNAFTSINVTRKPLDDVRVRRALHLLADRPAIIKVAWATEGMLTVFFVPEPYGKWEFPNDEMLKLPGYRADKTPDIEEAKKLLAEAGQSSGLSLTLAVRTIPQHTRTGEMLREQFKVAGIDLKLDALETAVWTERKTKENYDLLLDPYGVDSDDPSPWLENILAPGISFKDDQLDAWKKEQTRILDFPKRKELVRKIEMRLLETLPVIPSVRGGTYMMGLWDNIKNYPEPIGIWNSHKHTETWLAR
ncbi:MAG: ABC transporter substrate-binding protein [Chloroflexi bacterium]|nr:ABC transporter substrate-binding protein [Chloroflexota bacterium]